MGGGVVEDWTKCDPLFFYANKAGKLCFYMNPTEERTAQYAAAGLETMVRVQVFWTFNLRLELTSCFSQIGHEGYRGSR